MAALRRLLAAAALARARAQPWGPPDQARGEFAPGWNGMARTPPYAASSVPTRPSSLRLTRPAPSGLSLQRRRNRCCSRQTQTQALSRVLRRMGWSSWNCYGSEISQGMMMEAADALAAKNRTVPTDRAVSLCDLGYCELVVDLGWEGCGQGLNHTQHAADGTPTIEPAFPDVGAMVQHIHERGLRA